AQLPPSLPDDADPKQITERKRERADAFNLNNRIKGLKRYRAQGRDFRSHLPVSMDGTCNGYQHLSALGRDPIGGRATNLVPANEPQDIYQEVADHVSRRIQRDAENSEGREARARQGEASKDDQDSAR